jgi:hypothetical protein
MPRRRGKTEIAAVIEAAAMVTFQGRAGIFASVEAQTKEMLGTIYNRIVEFCSDIKEITRRTANMVEYSPKQERRDPQRGMIYAFSGKVDSARGKRMHRVYVDEASFTKANVITKNVFAAMLMAGTFVLMVSSPPDDQTHIFARMCNHKRSDGTSTFKYIRIDNTCDDCRQKPWVTRCPHVRLPAPRWLASNAEMDMIRDVLSKIDPIAYKHEILGIMADDDLFVYPGAVVDKFEKLARLTFTKPPDYVLVGVDTSSSGSSESAICAMAMDGDYNQVVSNVFVFK